MTHFSHIRARLRFLLMLILGISLLSGCSGMQTVRTLNHEEAGQRWNRYLDTGNSGETPVALTASVRYRLPDESGHRVLLTLWSNGSQPYRADISAGFNTIAAKILESPDVFSMYVPSEETLYFYDGPEKPGLNLGRPVPFTPESIIRLLTGKYATVFGILGSEPRLERNGDISYLLTGDNPVTDSARLTLDTQGRPVLWRGAQQDDWKMEFDYNDDSNAVRPGLPEQITLTQPDGYEAIFLIKSRKHPEKPFTQEQLKLKLPPDTKIQPFPTAKRART